MKRKIAMFGALVMVLGVIGGGVAAASSGGSAGGADADSGDTDVPISGAELGPASDAALAHLGEGKVTETEVGDEESYYEVEVTLENGSEVDVQLNRDFSVAGTEAETPGESEGQGDSPTGAAG